MYKYKILTVQKVTKNEHMKLVLESKLTMDDGFICHPNFSLSVTETKKFLDITSKKDIKPKLIKLFDHYLKDNIDNILRINGFKKLTIKVEEL